MLNFSIYLFTICAHTYILSNIILYLRNNSKYTNLNKVDIENICPDIYNYITVALLFIGPWVCRILYTYTSLKCEHFKWGDIFVLTGSFGLFVFYSSLATWFLLNTLLNFWCVDMTSLLVSVYFMVSVGHFIPWDIK